MSDRKNEYEPWKEEGITELQYFKRAFLEAAKSYYAEALTDAIGVLEGMRGLKTLDDCEMTYQLAWRDCLDRGQKEIKKLMEATDNE